MESNEHPNTYLKLHVHVPCCKPANQLVYAYQHPERGRGEGGGKGGEKISAARAAPRRPSGRNLRLKARAPEQYDHRAGSAKKVDLQSGTVRDSHGHQLS